MSATDNLKDETRLAELGYYQQLKREWNFWNNFGISFAIISVITPISSLFSYGLATGGPGVISGGWLVVGFFTLFVALSMAEIVSSVPVAGGPYFWAYMISPPQHAPFFSWFTGWFNLLGQIALTAGADFSLANLISTTAEVTNGYSPSPGKTLGIVALILVSHVCVNALGIRRLRFLTWSAIVLNSVGVGALAIAVLACAKHRNSARFVFANFYDGTAASQSDVGWSVRASPAYVAVVGVLFSQFTLLGFDASAHLAEETKQAVQIAPLCLISSVGASFVIGFLLLLCLLFSIQDFEQVRQSPIPVLKIFQDACGQSGGLVLMTIVLLCVWHSGFFSMTSNSRMMFSFARDGGIPHKLHVIDERFPNTPMRTVVFAAVAAFLLCLPSLGSSVAFQGTTSIATIGLFISYGMPIAMALVWPQNLRRGPFSLGRFGTPVRIVSCLWIGFLTIALCLPTINPVTSQTLNYSGVAVGIVGGGALASWLLWARHWFTGRCRDHCRTCIQQLDYLIDTTLMGDRTGSADSFRLEQSDHRHPQLRNNFDNNIAIAHDISVEYGNGKPHAITTDKPRGLQPRGLKETNPKGRYDEI